MFSNTFHNVSFLSKAVILGYLNGGQIISNTTCLIRVFQYPWPDKLKITVHVRRVLSYQDGTDINYKLVVSYLCNKRHIVDCNTFRNDEKTL